jgi:hypothetical protein
VQRRPEPEPPRLSDAERKRQGILLALLIAAIGVIFARWTIGWAPAEDKDIAWLAFGITAVLVGVSMAVLATVRRRFRSATSEELAAAPKPYKAWLPGMVGVVAPLAAWGPESIAWVVGGLFTGFGAGLAVGLGLGLLLTRGRGADAPPP